MGVLTMRKAIFTAGLLLVSSIVAAEGPRPATDGYGDPLPKRAVARLGTVRFLPTAQAVDKLVYSPDGKLLASLATVLVGNVRTGIQIWDVKTGKSVGPRALDGPDFSDVAWGPDGKHLAEFNGHTDKVRSLAFSPDSSLLVSGAQDTTILIWDLAAVRTKLPKVEPQPLQTGRFRWKTAAPVLLPRNVGGQPFHAVKDPTVVRYGGKWHLFCTVRGTKRSHAIVYLAFADWKVANKAKWHVLPTHAGFFCAPQVFYFRPHKKWYLICQAADDAWSPRYQPAFATTKDVADPKSWSKLKPLFGRKPKGDQVLARFLGHLRRRPGVSVLHVAGRENVALGDDAGRFSARLVAAGRRAQGRRLRGQPHVPVEGAAEIPDRDRGAARPRLAVLQGVHRRDARR
jgi:hypothetical protein